MKPRAEGAQPRPPVCRRLFADDGDDPVDHGLRDNMFNQITEQINRDLDEACKKYNFDFRSEVPLEGDWAWERISPEGHGRARPVAATTESSESLHPSEPSEESTGPQEAPTPTCDLQDNPAETPTVPQ